MNPLVDRRSFLAGAAAAGLSAGVLRADEKEPAGGANDTIVVAVMGTNGRGNSLAGGFAQRKGVEIAYICDVDERAVNKGIKTVSSHQSRTPEGLTDFRKALDDKNVDALVCAAPNHWHAPATILACAAGKHVYVEKPCSHNPHEGELMVAAARKYNRVVQHGTQRRSSPNIQAGIEQLREGVIGNVTFARSWYCSRRPSIGRGQPGDVPTWLDYSLWQGPAPERPFVSNLVHYNWHWRWHWGNGELGNNGVHSIDVCRWGLGVDYPIRVTSGGGRYRFEDDQETPDTHIVTFDFDGKSIVWEGLSWSPRGFEGSTFGTAFHGDAGTMILNDNNWIIYDMQNKEASRGSVPGGWGEAHHQEDFLAAIRNDKRPAGDIEEGYKSTLLCHLGNIAHRTGRTLHTDPTNGHIKDDPQAQALWKREYRQGWEPKV